jgi:uncharacterized protein YceK
MSGARIFAIIVICLLSGCSPKASDTNSSSGSSSVSNSASSAERQQPGAKLAYRHQLGLEMSGVSVSPRFERARDRCLKDAELGCVVLEASINLAGSWSQPQASLRVRLPHPAVEPFERSLQEPLPGEKSGDPLVRSKSTTAEDLAQAIADADRRLAQLTDYRDRLAALLKRPDAKVEDLIKVQSELSTTQSQIEAITEQKRQLDERVATEILAITFAAHPTFGEPRNPIADVWHDGTRLLGQSAANALRFVIEIIPWVPVILVAAGLLAGLRKLIKRLRRRPL